MSQTIKQLTLRGFDPELRRRIQSLARREGISLNRAALRLMRAGAGLRESCGDEQSVIGSALDQFIGTWSDGQADAINEAAREFDIIDGKMWRG